MDVGATISKHRRERGFTQKKLCEMAGISQQALSAIEHGLYVPSYKMLCKILDALGYEIFIVEHLECQAQVVEERLA